MWSRVVEFMLACWLSISPFIFRHADEAVVLWASDFVCAVLIGTFALLSYWPPARHAHLLSVLVALWLIGFGRFGGEHPVSAGMQNEITVGLLLLMFAIVPNDATRPPWNWYRDAMAPRGRA